MHVSDCYREFQALIRRVKGFLYTWHEAVLVFSPSLIILGFLTNKFPHFRRPYV